MIRCLLFYSAPHALVYRPLCTQRPLLSAGLCSRRIRWEAAEASPKVSEHQTAARTHHLVAHMKLLNMSASVLFNNSISYCVGI